MCSRRPRSARARRRPAPSSASRTARTRPTTWFRTVGRATPTSPTSRCRASARWFPPATARGGRLTDNGYGARENSADYQLAIYRIDAATSGRPAPEVLSTTVLHDPDRHVPWRSSATGPAHRCPTCRSTSCRPRRRRRAAATRPPGILTGFDFDPESMQVGPDGTFWIGDEFGPFLLHADATGKLLEPPDRDAGHQGAAEPDARRGRRRGAERRDQPRLRGPGDQPRPQDAVPAARRRRRRRPPAGRADAHVRHPAPPVQRRRPTHPPGDARRQGQPHRAPAAPTAPSPIPTHVAPTGTGGQAHGELTAINNHQFLVPRAGRRRRRRAAPRFKKLFLIDTRAAAGGYVSKHLLADLMAVPDPDRSAVTATTSASRSTRSSRCTPSTTRPPRRQRQQLPVLQRPVAQPHQRAHRTAVPDDNEMILIRLGTRSTSTGACSNHPGDRGRGRQPGGAVQRDCAAAACPAGGQAVVPIGGHLRQQSLPSLAEPNQQRSRARRVSSERTPPSVSVAWIVRRSGAPPPRSRDGTGRRPDAPVKVPAVARPSVSVIAATDHRDHWVARAPACDRPHRSRGRLPSRSASVDSGRSEVAPARMVKPIRAERLR